MTLTRGQKKVLGITLVIIFVPVLLLLFAMLIYSMFESGGGVGKTEFSFLFSMGIFFFPLWLGLRLWKIEPTKSSLILDTLEANTHDMHSSGPIMRVQTKIELPEYRKLVFRLTYTAPLFVFLNFLGVSMLIYYLLYGDANWFTLFIMLFILYMPILVYRSATSTYKITNALHENQSYEFSAESIAVTGESFNYTIMWKTLHKVKEVKNWFLLYTNKQSAIMIPKKAFTSLSDLNAFREMTKEMSKP